MKRKGTTDIWTELYRTSFPDGILLIWAINQSGYISDFSINDWHLMTLV